jgi:hypothetical protein
MECQKKKPCSSHGDSVLRSLAPQDIFFLAAETNQNEHLSFGLVAAD